MLRGESRWLSRWASSLPPLIGADGPFFSSLGSFSRGFGQVLGLFDAADAPGRHSGDERIAVYAQAARGAALVPVLPLERAKKIGLLEPVSRLAERERLTSDVARALTDFVDGQVHGQVVEPDHGARGQGHAPLDDVLELAHIAGPVIGHEGGQGAPRDAAHVLLELARVLPQEVLDEARDVLLARAERRNGEGHHVEAVEEVFAE